MRLRYQIVAILIAAVTLPISIIGYSHWTVLVSIWLASAAAVALVMSDEVHPQDLTGQTTNALKVVHPAADPKAMNDS